MLGEVEPERVEAALGALVGRVDVDQARPRDVAAGVDALQVDVQVSRRVAA